MNAGCVYNKNENVILVTIPSQGGGDRVVIEFDKLVGMRMSDEVSQDFYILYGNTGVGGGNYIQNFDIGSTLADINWFFDKGTTMMINPSISLGSLNIQGSGAGETGGIFQVYPQNFPVAKYNTFLIEFRLGFDNELIITTDPVNPMNGAFYLRFWQNQSIAFRVYDKDNTEIVYVNGASDTVHSISIAFNYDLNTALLQIDNGASFNFPITKTDWQKIVLRAMAPNQPYSLKVNRIEAQL